ncbi:MAG TPA: transketolase, partial [Anaerolineae bacterium]|nr:transketolase [Anaerolineae bacterium]
MTKQPDLQALKELARDLRLDVLEMTTRVASGHVSSSYSCVEILTALYFGGVLRYRSDEPHWPQRDRFFLSKGHTAPIFYAVLARAGYFDRDELWGLRTVDRRAEEHPEQDKLPGIEMTSGS